ncbi:MAG: DNA cytosine methyltransferase [Chloroflexota bacterium]|nr:DNA cytosine methyltransferase [Chloroflexota bacterium]
MRLLDLFCGAGGAAMGYHRAGFEVVGVDHLSQPHYPFEFHQADALNFLSEHGAEFDVIHASPPCQAYTGLRNVTLSRFGTAPEHPDLIVATRAALRATGIVYVIENVQGSPLRTQIILCGAALGLPHLARHRHFESNLLLFAPPCQHRENEYTIGIYGSRPDGRRVSYRRHKLCRVADSLEEARAEMGIDWMTWAEITQAIPPVYTEYVGRQLMEALG